MLLSAVALMCLASPATGAAAPVTVDSPVSGNCSGGEECALRGALAATGTSADPEDTAIVPSGDHPLTDGAYELQRALPTPAEPSAIADLSLSIDPDPPKPATGRKVAFVVNVRNLGPQTAPGVVFKGMISSAAIKVAGLLAGACEFVKATTGKREVDCQVGAVEAGTVRSFRFVLITKATPKYLVTRGRVRSGVTDPTTEDAHAKAIVRPLTW